jgi:hypothetical protein
MMVLLPTPLRDKLDAVCDRHHLNKQDVFRMALERGLPILDAQLASPVS